jgi:hypothetical protein
MQPVLIHNQSHARQVLAAYQRLPPGANQQPSPCRTSPPADCDVPTSSVASSTSTDTPLDVLR